MEFSAVVGSPTTPEVVSGEKISVPVVSPSQTKTPPATTASNEHSDAAQVSVPSAPGSDSAKSTAEQEKASLEKAVEEANIAVRDTSVRFEKTDDTTINFRVIEKDTGRVLLEYPPDEGSRLIASGKLNTGRGLIIDKKA